MAEEPPGARPFFLLEFADAARQVTEIFVRRDGGWHPLHSQHGKAE